MELKKILKLYLGCGLPRYAFMNYYKEDKGYVAYPNSFLEKGNIYFIPIWWAA